MEDEVRSGQLRSDKVRLATFFTFLHFLHFSDKIGYIFLMHPVQCTCPEAHKPDALITS